MKRPCILSSLLLLTSALAAPLSAKDLWVMPVHAEPPQLNLTWTTTQFGLARFAFGVPEDMANFQSAHVVFLPSASASGNYSVFLEVKRDGETVSAFDIDALSDVPASFTANEITEVNISGVFAGSFDGTSAGNDHVGLIVYAPGDLVTSARILGLRFSYFPDLVSGSQLATNAVSSAKVVDNSLTGTDLADGSIGNADLGDNSVTASKIVNGAVGNADLAPGAVTNDKILAGTITGANISSQTINRIHLVDEAGVEFAGGSQTFGLAPVGQTVRSIDVAAPVPGFVTVHAAGSFELIGDSAEARCGIRTDTLPTVPSGATRAKLGTIVGGSLYIIVPFAVTEGFSVNGGTTTTFRLVCDTPFPFANVLNSHMTATFTPTRY
ncbi:MAG: hypothetical protein ACRD3V_00520 [Vicinamibacteria bacterium]